MITIPTDQRTLEEQSAPAERVSAQRLEELIALNARAEAETPSAVWSTHYREQLQILRELSRLRREGDAPQWQPIETAPRDVEVLLGWVSTWPTPAWQVAAGLAGSTKGGWIHGNATHWRPLPEQPAKEQKEQSR